MMLIVVGQRVDVTDKVPVVLVYTKTGSWGSGVIVDQSLGVVLTCSHVVNSESQGASSTSL